MKWFCVGQSEIIFVWTSSVFFSVYLTVSRLLHFGESCYVERAHIKMLHQSLKNHIKNIVNISKNISFLNFT